MVYKVKFMHMHLFANDVNMMSNTLLNAAIILASRLDLLSVQESSLQDGLLNSRALFFIK